MSDDFESPKTWIKQAREDIALLQQAQTEAIKNAKFETTSYLKNDQKYWVARSTNNPPDTLKTRVAGILNALRSALDQATWQSSMLLDASDNDHIYFPFAGNKISFDNCFKKNGRAKSIPKDLHPFLQNLNAYPKDASHEGGNTLLYCISKLTNPNKHKRTHRIGIQFSGDMTVDHFTCDGLCIEYKIPPDSNHETDELIVAITEPSAKVSYKFKMAPQLAFGQTPFVSGLPVLAILRKQASICEGIVLGIEAETARIRGQ